MSKWRWAGRIWFTLNYVKVEVGWSNWVYTELCQSGGEVVEFGVDCTRSNWRFKKMVKVKVEVCKMRCSVKVKVFAMR